MKVERIVTKKGYKDWADLRGRTISFEWSDGYDDFTRIMDFSHTEPYAEDPRYPRYYIMEEGGGGCSVWEDEDVEVTVYKPEIKFRSDMQVDFIDSVGTDETVARAARVSLGRDQYEQGEIKGLINYLVREGHTSTLEHCVMTLRFEVPIFVHRQIMTHRTLSRNSESGRYTELKPVFYVPSMDRPLINAGTSSSPDLVHGSEDLYELMYEDHVNVAVEGWGRYQVALELGAAKEVARNFLPVTTYTSMWATANLLGWFNFLRLRNGTNGHPQYEIVEVANQVEKYVEEFFPITYEAWKRHQ